ncbi:MAG: hypothetical protein SV760_07800, partial [Halobacteria archaeon]|nr:hypothetical protein [Halobacteria archaeon]
MEKGNRIVEKLREVIGEGLAVVGRVDAERDPPEYDHFYLRDDIREMYDDEEMENISHEAVLTILEKSHRDSLFKYGDFQYLVLGFEEKT